MSSSQHTRGMPPFNDRIGNIRKKRDHVRSIPTPATAFIHTRAHKIFEKINLCWNGQRVSIPPAATIRVRGSEYQKLLRLLAQDQDVERFAFRQLKLFYNNQSCRLSYEMVTSIHDGIQENVKGVISEQFGVLKARSAEAKRVLDIVRNRGSTTIPLSENKDTKVSPDALYMLRKGTTETPCFFLEVSFSQSLKAAKNKVRKIIRDTKGSPGLGLIIKVPYATPKQLADPRPDLPRAATYHLFKWTTEKGADGVVENKVVRVHRARQFRDENGKLVPGKLSITLRDFVGEAQLPKFPFLKDPEVASALDEVIEIDHSELERWLEELESSARDGALDLSSDAQEDPDEVPPPDDEVVDGVRTVVEQYSDDEDESDTSTLSATSSEKSEGSEFVPSSESGSSGSNDSRSQAVIGIELRSIAHKVDQPIGEYGTAFGEQGNVA